MGFKLVNGDLVELTPEEEAAFALPPPAPAEVPMWKARIVMATTPAGPGTILDAALAYIASIPDAAERTTAEIVLEYPDNLRRDAPLVAAVTAALGLTSEQIDDLFRAAAAIF